MLIKCPELKCPRKVFKNICVILLLFIMIIPPVTSDAHPGRTDRYGGHYNRKTGEYHYHNSGYSGRSTSSSSRTSKKKAARKKAESAVKAVRPLTQQEAAREANIKLRANHFYSMMRLSVYIRKNGHLMY